MRQCAYITMVVAFLLCETATTCGSPGKDLQTKLSGLYDRLVSSRNDAEKLGINDSIRILIGSYAVSDTAITHKFDGLRYLGQIISPDKKVKIINWNLILENHKSRYYCYIIHKPSRKEAGRVYTLEAEYRETPAECDRIYHDSNWYGSLYYDIMPVKKSGVENWLYWIDLNNQLLQESYCVISFDKEGSFTWSEIVCFRDVVKYREVFEYSLKQLCHRFTGTDQ